MEILNEFSNYFGVILLFFLVLTAIAVVAAKNLIISTVLLGMFSLLMAVEYLVMGAADVAITEAAVGAGISTILFLMTLFLVGDKEKKSKNSWLWPLIVVVLVSFGLLYATFGMPSFGAEYGPSQLHVSPYYLQQAPIETGIPNVVTSILASYRGYDTLGETVVVLAAAIALMLLLGRFGKKEGDSE